MKYCPKNCLILSIYYSLLYRENQYGAYNPFSNPAYITPITPGVFTYEEGAVTAPWNVLSTDYVNYAVTLSCVHGNDGYGILTRTPTIQPQSIPLAYAALEANNLSPLSLIQTTRVNC